MTAASAVTVQAGCSAEARGSPGSLLLQHIGRVSCSPPPMGVMTQLPVQTVQRPLLTAHLATLHLHVHEGDAVEHVVAYSMGVLLATASAVTAENVHPDAMHLAHKMRPISAMQLRICI